MQLINSLPVASAPLTTNEQKVIVHSRQQLRDALPRWEAFLIKYERLVHSRQPKWLTVLERGLAHTPYCLEAIRGNETIGFLPLSYVQSKLFGRFLVSLPYLNYGGPIVVDSDTTHLLVDRAVQLADELDVRYLELRGTAEIDHPALKENITSKVHMRLPLPGTTAELWESFSPKVRNQIRKGEKSELTTVWGSINLLPEFYHVFARNMRDLGTPVFSKKLFQSILETFPDQAELCVVRFGSQPIASALLLHGSSETEVPSASSLRQFNGTNANMLMYWHLLSRAVERRQQVFDFGRSSVESGTYRFKAQWGATPHPAVWQYYVRQGKVGEMRPDSPKYRRFIQAWQHLPVWLTRLIGPAIVRGIP